MIWGYGVGTYPFQQWAFISFSSIPRLSYRGTLRYIRKNVFSKSELNWTFEVYIVCSVSWPAVSCAALLLQLTKLVAGLYFPDWHVMTFSDIYWEVRGGGGGGGVIIGWACHALLAAVELPTILREVLTITEKAPTRNFSRLKAPRLLKC